MFHSTVVVIVVGFVKIVRRNEMSETSIEHLHDIIDKVIEAAYEEGWKDCKENLSLQPGVNYATYNLLLDTHNQMNRQYLIQKRKLSLAIKLIRYAQMTPCGKDGQFDRFFQEYSEEYEHEVGQMLIDVYG